MTIKLSTIFVIAQVILLAAAMPPNSTDSTNSTGRATDSYGCFKKGELWKDLGTNESIIQAYDEQWCKNNVGLEPLGLKVNLCIRDQPIKHAFMWKWEITEVPDGKDEGFISHDVCICFIAQALNMCEKGGIFDLVCGPGTDGGDVIGAHILADPQGSFSCNG
ncbi:hypothetical protein INS49_006403 [Diaporthe citri]|uniref:uncharacterized protein n=1 Tax=Diaporthe citri TaxID=83186 RepID=UPI001C812412|nr:uncharacterized protein INS49_006403 [Diaporthe citri]KAG6364799.1 hypothetical protein INS49_006403 [Diaporthe citri]